MLFEAIDDFLLLFANLLAFVEVGLQFLVLYFHHSIVVEFLLQLLGQSFVVTQLLLQIAEPFAFFGILKFEVMNFLPRSRVGTSNGVASLRVHWLLRLIRFDRLYRSDWILERIFSLFAFVPWLNLRDEHILLSFLNWPECLFFDLPFSLVLFDFSIDALFIFTVFFFIVPPLATLWPGPVTFLQAELNFIL